MFKWHIAEIWVGVLLQLLNRKASASHSSYTKEPGSTD
jgi:hypothetical protein